MAAQEIMLIDDDKIQYILLNAALKRLKYDHKVIYYADPEEGLKALLLRKADNLPLFVFLDLHMPKMTGWQFLDQYDSCEHKAKIVLLTSSIDKADEKKAIHHKYILSFHTKPIIEDELRKIINLCT